MKTATNVKTEKRGRWNHALKVVQKYYPEVTSVKDATHSKLIHVTERDCHAGKSKRPDSCALAKAACGKNDGAIISLAVAYLINGRKALRYRVPSRIARELVSFDRSHIFAPGMYRLSAPTSNEKLGFTRKKAPGNRPLKKGGPIRRAYRTTGIRSLYEHHG